MKYFHIFNPQNYILFKILASFLCLKYSRNFANFSLDILIKLILFFFSTLGLLDALYSFLNIRFVYYKCTLNTSYKTVITTNGSAKRKL